MLKLGDIIINRQFRGFYLTKEYEDGVVIFDYKAKRDPAYNSLARFYYNREGGHERY